jgi:methionyl-tRNA formyltransferase
MNRAISPASSKIGILTSQTSSFAPFALGLKEDLHKRGYVAEVFNNHEEISSDYNIVFILSYFRKIPADALRRHLHNLVVHASDLPRGRGWAPFFWQILEKKNKIPIVLFEATEELDAGPIYLKDAIVLEGHELHDELRSKQAHKCIELCLRFLSENPKPVSQRGEPSFYRKRTQDDGELDIDKPLRELFNNLRIASNDNYPAFFRIHDHKYVIQVFKERRRS